MQETWVQSLGQEDPLEKGMAAHPLQYSCLENSMNRGSWQATAHGLQILPGETFLDPTQV